MRVSQPKRPKRRSRQSWLKTAFQKSVATAGPFAIAAVMLVLRWTCRIRFHNDPRAALRKDGVPYVYSVLHAQQLAAATCGDKGTAAMVSQSRDGELVALGLKCVGIIPIRGSSRRNRDNGGLTALHNLMEHVRTGLPAYLAVDGPRGPRNRVHKGIAVLSQQTGAAVLNIVVVPSRRLIVKQSWDRLQIPMPFCRIDINFASPIRPQAGETVENYRRRIEASLNEYEALCDPTEAAHAARSQTPSHIETPPAASAA